MKVRLGFGPLSAVFDIDFLPDDDNKNNLQLVDETAQGAINAANRADQAASRAEAAAAKAEAAMTGKATAKS